MKKKINESFDHRRGRSYISGTRHEAIRLGYGNLRGPLARHRGGAGQGGHKESLRHRSPVTLITVLLLDVHAQIEFIDLTILIILAGDLNSDQEALPLDRLFPDPQPLGRFTHRTFAMAGFFQNSCIKIYRNQLHTLPACSSPCNFQSTPLAERSTRLRRSHPLYGGASASLQGASQSAPTQDASSGPIA